ncbi:MAG: BPSS1780 family membrane protein [Betaproteobacteria bacterium]
MDNMNPAASSSAAQPASGSAPPPEGWAVGAGRGASWWGEGWRLFKATPWVWLAILIIYFVLMIVLAVIPIIGQIASWLFAPVVVGGVMLGTRDLDRGGELSVGDLFRCFSFKLGPLIVLSLLLAVGWIVISIVGVVALVVAGAGSIGTLMSGDASQSGAAMLATLGTAGLIVVLVMVLLIVPLIMAYWFAPALVVFRGDAPMAAMKASFKGCWRNIPPFLVYGLVGMLLAIVASIPFGLGWFIVAPMAAASVYASYCDIFGKP